MKIAALLALIPISCSALGANEPLQRFEFARLQMGTQVRIVLYAQDEPSARDASGAAFGRVEEIESVMSHYREDSEVSRLSARGGQGPQRISPELLHLLSAALSFSRKTGGAFDVTVGPLVDLWRKARRTRRLPDDVELRDALRRVGFRNLVLDEKAMSAQLNQSGMKLDLSAIAKGYAADEALRVLRSKRCGRALVDAGGDIALGDPPPGKKGWKVAIEAVKGETRATRDRALVLHNVAVATSGDAYQFIEIGGARYSHIVDPKTGLGVREAASATAIAPDCLTADALATSLCVLSPEAGLRLVESTPGAAACVIRRSGEGIRRYASRSFPP